MEAELEPVSSTSIEIIQSWGVASARNCSGCLVHPDSAAESEHEHLYDVPIGPSMVRWDVISQKRVKQFQAHSDLITCLRKSPDGAVIASSSYSGEVKIWSPQWVCLDSTKAPVESQFHVSSMTS